MQKLQMAKYVLTELFTPGGIPAETKALAATKGELGPHGEEYTLGNELGLASVGLETRDLDPVHVMDVAISKYKQQLNIINKHQESFFGSEDKPNINLSDQQILKEAYDLNNAKFKALSELKFTYDQMKILDSDLNVGLIPKQQKNLNIIRQLNSGVYKPLETFTRAFLKNYKEEEDIKERLDNNDFIVLPRAVDDLGNMKRDISGKELDVNKTLDDYVDKDSSWYENMKSSNFTIPNILSPILGGPANAAELLPTHIQEMNNIQNSPMPNQNILNNPQNNQVAMGNNNFGALHNGLTISENALLTPEEQAIRLRERGLA
jgi:hypothetical protein